MIIRGVLALYNVNIHVSYVKNSLISKIPVIPIGVSGRSWAVACVCIGASA